MKGIFSVLVENKAGVLSKTAGLFARRGFNIDSLAVGETDDRDISSMTIISTGDERIMEQIEKQLNKKIDVIKVRRFAENKCVTRELLMLKVTYTNVTRSDIMEICKLGVETCYWPLFEVVEGKWILNYEPKKKLPIEDFLRPQGRFKHLFKKENEYLIEAFQKEVDRRWEELQFRCSR